MAGNQVVSRHTIWLAKNSKQLFEQVTNKEGDGESMKGASKNLGRSNKQTVACSNLHGSNNKTWEYEIIC